MKTKTALIALLGLITLAWAWDALWMHPAGGALPWIIRQHTLYLTGLFAISLMSLVMILSTRPAWLEPMLGGMDQVYRLHKQAGILAIVSGAAHWLVKLSSGPLKVLAGVENRPAREAVLAIMQAARPVAKDLGEWTVYLLLAMLLLTLWKRFPYRSWRLVHRLMPILYLILVFHTVALMPLAYWSGPTGVIQALLMLGGSAACALALTGRIGYRRRHTARVHSVREIGDGVTEVVCTMGASWPGHQPGQFAFVTFNASEGAHPFTIASASHNESRQLAFQIKGLGDYTRTLAHTLKPGQAVQIEGPYGHLHYGRARQGAGQIWVAGGIGVTPFLAWLDAIRQHPATAPRAQLHYCVRDASTDPFVARLQQVCADLPTITLTVHDATRHEHLDARTLRNACRCDGDHIDIWFCGPMGLASSLRQGFRALGCSNVQIRQEAFDMR